MRHGIAYASCGHAFHPLCLLEYEKHAGQRVTEAVMKCPLCRQPYTVRHFIPDDNLRSLCLEHTLHEAILLAEAASKEADEKAKEAGQARQQASQAAHHATRLRQQAGSSFCSAPMAARLASLQRISRMPLHAAPADAMRSLAGAPVGRSTQPLVPSAVHSASRGPGSFVASGTVARSSNVGNVGGAAVRRLHHSPAANLAAAIGQPAAAADPGPGFDLGVHVPLHEQIASMRITDDAETLQSAAQHPEVVLGIEEPEQI